jgi:hypothetical protein
MQLNLEIDGGLDRIKELEKLGINVSTSDLQALEDSRESIALAQFQLPDNWIAVEKTNPSWVYWYAIQDEQGYERAWIRRSQRASGLFIGEDAISTEVFIWPDWSIHFHAYDRDMNPKPPQLARYNKTLRTATEEEILEFKKGRDNFVEYCTTQHL